jgi:signal transduction histidine kinase/CheY-like chemotaxis protein
VIEVDNGATRQPRIPAGGHVVALTDRLASLRLKGSLFRKYLVLFLVVIGLALISPGPLEFWFAYQQQKELLGRTRLAQAAAAAATIRAHIGNIEDQIGWVTQPVWSADALDDWRFDAQRLLRQVQAITELVLLDAEGREQLRVSRLTRDIVGSQADFSTDPRFVEAMAHKVYYGPVYFRDGSEPYMSVAKTGNRAHDGVTIAEVNLKEIWDVVSQIKVGERGRAYVIDRQGRLIAHPDLSLVLNYTDLSDLPQVAAARPGTTDSPSQALLEGHDLRGQRVVAAYARVAPLRWLVFAEVPVDEAYAPLSELMRRSGMLFLVGLALAVIAGLFFVGRMMVPIRAMREGAARIGGGDLSSRIAVSTGDELEELGQQFNKMAAQLQESYASLERKVEERTRQLALANAAKTRFIAAASHDLRQPLHALGLLVEQLRSHSDAPNRARVVERIGTAIAEMNELFNSLLDISKLEAGVVAPNLTEFPIARLLSRIETNFAGPAYQKGLVLRVVPSSTWVRSDAILLERILLNLVSNAVRYTSRGGVVVGCRRRDTALRIEVCDSGRGIAEDQRQAIFTEFYQGSGPVYHRNGGLGLGLAIVDRGSRLLDHPIELASVVGKGSRFSVLVPIAAAVDHHEGFRAPAVVNDRMTGRQVVVIEDDALVRESTSGVLRSWGCQVTTVVPDDAVINDVARRARPPDLIISDYHLADGKTGIDVIEQLRRSFGRRIAALLISGDLSPIPLQQARAKGYLLLHKPVEPMALRAALSKLLKDDAGERPQPAVPHPLDSTVIH